LVPRSLQNIIKLKIWDGVDEPGDLLFEKEVFLFELFGGENNYIRLDTLVYVDQHFFVGYEIYYENNTDTFALYTGSLDTALSSVPALMNRGSGWEYLNDGLNIHKVSLVLSPLVLDFYPPKDTEFGTFPFGEVTLYPNPAYDILQVLLEKKPEDKALIRIYDLFGHLVSETTMHHPEPNFSINISNLPASGIYFLYIECDGLKSYNKFLHFE
jgi:hypothetical protein